MTASSMVNDEYLQRLFSRAFILRRVAGAAQPQPKARVVSMRP
jgi:hypothetical protein